ncbi:hypothetical protein CXQ85_004271 [Candidozyma haemuli]|uniref:Uncharacterized protein n=1 Tax=Candidozyma haemuli TaxID=45357 RepID=A0A2V1ASP9_9ASCO|nr:hypothetical protein CXQ85_004271 [[Candida] haemuloni]PVH20764.1 hypothetical protein CXQ85_004271 [[Candida] haemuloni]
MSSLPPKPPATYQKENNEKQPESQEKQINLPEQQVPKLHKTKDSIVKYSFEDSGDWYDFSRFLVKSFEHASPGSTGKMTEFIPEKWPLGKTEYYFGYFGYCRRSEKMPTVCHGSMESPLKAIVHDIGTVLAEGMETNERKKKQIVLSWENAVDNALRSAKEAIRSITSGARFLNATQERDIDYTTIDVPTVTSQDENAQKPPEFQEMQIEVPDDLEMLQKEMQKERDPSLIRFLLILVCLGFHIWLWIPTIPTSTVKYSVGGSGDWYDFSRFLVDAFEDASPGSTGKMAEYIPEKWPLGETQYYIHYYAYCRKSEKQPTVCHKGAENPLESIIYDIGTVIAQEVETNKINQDHIALSWVKAVGSALDKARKAVQEIPDAARFLNGTQQREINDSTIDIMKEFDWDFWNDSHTLMLLLSTTCFVFGMMFLLVPYLVYTVMGFIILILGNLPPLIYASSIRGKSSGIFVKSHYLGHTMICVAIEVILGKQWSTNMLVDQQLDPQQTVAENLNTEQHIKHKLLTIDYTVCLLQRRVQAYEIQVFISDGSETYDYSRTTK